MKLQQNQMLNKHERVKRRAKNRFQHNDVYSTSHASQI